MGTWLMVYGVGVAGFALGMLAAGILGASRDD